MWPELGKAQEMSPGSLCGSPQLPLPLNKTLGVSRAPMESLPAWPSCWLPHDSPCPLRHRTGSPSSLLFL